MVCIRHACALLLLPVFGACHEVDGDAVPNEGDAVGGDPIPCIATFDAPKDRSRPIALLVTSDALAAAFQPLADLHTALGDTTALITIETICGTGCSTSDHTRDAAHAIKAHLALQPSLRYVILGGDFDHVPSRRVHDFYKNPIDPSYEYDSDFYTDYYFADLSEWDNDGDGTYAEDGIDTPDYIPELVVARVPASTATEVAGYIAKVQGYLRSFPADSLTRALVVSDVAATYLSVDIDSAWYFEDSGRTLDLLPSGFTVDKLYATSLSPDTSAPKLTLNALETAFTTGYNLIIHNGHGSENTAIYTPDGELTGLRASTLRHDTQPILLSCACLAGSFNEPDLVLRTDAAGERLVLNPHGGAIAYLGNTAVGLGLAGGNQLIDEMLRYISANAFPLLGDALLVAHNELPNEDIFRIPYIEYDLPVVDQTSYEWTQKSVVLLGDPLLPIWTSVPAAAPSVTVTTEPLCAGTRVTVSVAPVGADRVRVVAGSSLYEKSLTQSTTTFDVQEAPPFIVVGVNRSGHFLSTVIVEP